MPNFPDYNSPPIVEAIIELAFSGPWVEPNHRDLLARLEPLYSGGSRDAARPNRDGSMTRGVFLEKPGGQDVVGLGIGSLFLTVHVLQPYPRWLNFVARADEALEHYVASMHPLELTRVGVRYIDRIAIPFADQSINLHRYFSCVPHPPRGTAHMNALHITFQGADPDGTQTLLTISSDEPEESESGRLPIIYDLNVEQTINEPVAIENWKGLANVLHDRQRAIFEASITDHTRELFGWEPAAQS